MGYRLYMTKISKKYACGGKLFGYTDTSKLKSYQWLLKKGFLEGIDDDEITFAECNGNPQIVLRPEEFEEFVKLYNEDCNNYNGWLIHPKDWIINDKRVKELIKSKNDILLEWY